MALNSSLLINSPVVSSRSLASCHHSLSTSFFSEERILAERQFMKMYDDKKQLLHQIDSKSFRIKRQFYERFTTPGKSLSYVLKKKYIEDVIKKAIFNGTTQFIKFFSGFDLLFWELSSTFPDVTFIEIDQDHFISKKERVLCQPIPPKKLFPEKC